jgi:hypothetical protein
MDSSSWLTPPSLDVQTSGVRPSGAELLQLVDTTDPAFMHIAAVLRQLRDAGVTLDAATVAEAVEAGRQRWTDAQAPPVPQAPIAPAFDSIVYYLLRGPLVKIGTTRDPASRFASLMPDRILAVEPGRQPLERQRHVQFTRLRVGTSEYFEQAPDLSAHIEAVRKQYGTPNPDWPTTENLTRSRTDFYPAPPPALSPEMVTVAEAARRLTIRVNTVSNWVYRGLVKPVSRNELGRPLYLLDDMSFLADRSSALADSRTIQVL